MTVQRLNHSLMVKPPLPTGAPSDQECPPYLSPSHMHLDGARCTPTASHTSQPHPFKPARQPQRRDHERDSLLRVPLCSMYAQDGAGDALEHCHRQTKAYDQHAAIQSHDVRLTPSTVCVHALPHHRDRSKRHLRDCCASLSALRMHKTVQSMPYTIAIDRRKPLISVHSPSVGPASSHLNDCSTTHPLCYGQAPSTPRCIVRPGVISESL